MAVLMRNGEGETIPAGPSTSLVKVPAAATEGRASVIEMSLDADWEGPPPHLHDQIDHIWYVVDGSVEVRLGDGQFQLGPGDVAWVPHGEAHSFGTTDRSAVMLQIDTPRALDAYFRDLAKAFPRGTKPDPAVVADIMRRHDTHSLQM